MLNEKVLLALSDALDHIEEAGESGVVLIAWGGNVAAGSVPDMSSAEKLDEILRAAGRAAMKEGLSLTMNVVDPWGVSP